MTSRKAAVVSFILCLPLMSIAEHASATLYCDRPYTDLKQDPGRPHNAVGFLNNGCTASLIDANHIVAAAHCFVNTTTGDWQTGLRFYPNFHPDRVAAGEKNVPRGDIRRAVVGSRAGETVMGPGMDWGIARIENWRDTAGLDLTPLALYPSVPAIGMALGNPAYTRHHFPYNGPDMEWDKTYCGWVGVNGGMWAIRMGKAPLHDGANPDFVGCNSRWGAGRIHANCSVKNPSGDVVVHNCDTAGGSSGSPIMHKDAQGRWSIIAVGHGGGTDATKSSNHFEELTPACTNDTPANSDNLGPSVERFRDAPRFASSVAVHRSPYNASATAVFAVDSDLNQIVWRIRQGNAPTYTSRFSFWKSMGAPYDGARLGKVAACTADASAKPQVFVVASSALYTRATLPSGRWGAWSRIAAPADRIGFVDIDAISDARGRCQLFAAATNGTVFTRTKSSAAQWGNWKAVAIGSYRKITALNYAGTIWATMLDTAGEIWRTSQGQTGWTSPKKLGRPPGVDGWRDIDMTWDEGARGFMVAIPTSRGNRLWIMPMYGDKAWSEWRHFETHLWAPHGSTNLWRGTWTTGWTSLVPFQLDGEPYLLAYKSGTGRVAIDKFNPDGAGTSAVWPPPGAPDAMWTTGWTSLVPFQLDGKPYLLAYKNGTGRVAIDKFNPDGAGTSAVWPPPGAPDAMWTTGWTSLIPFWGHLFAYKRGSGDVAVDSINGNGQGTTPSWHATWRPGLTAQAPFALSGMLHLLSYRTDNGAVVTSRVFAHRPPGLLDLWSSQWTTGWTSLVPFELGGKPHLLAYKRQTGEVAVDKIRNDGQGTTTVGRWKWSKGWTLMVPFQLGGKPHVLLYNNGTGEVAIDRIDDLEHDAPNIQSVTASRWMEDRPGVTSPVVFATDDSGNVYFIEYARRHPAGWVLDWKSFYHETIPY